MQAQAAAQKASAAKRSHRGPSISTRRSGRISQLHSGAACSPLRRVSFARSNPRREIRVFPRLRQVAHVKYATSSKAFCTASSLDVNGEHFQNGLSGLAVCSVAIRAIEDPVMLTRKQHELLMFSHAHIRETGVLPLLPASSSS